MHQEQGTEVQFTEPGLYLRNNDSEQKLWIAAGLYEPSSEVATISYLKEMSAVSFGLYVPTAGFTLYKQKVDVATQNKEPLMLL